MINFIVMGAPGSGKGTQSKLLAADEGFKTQNDDGLRHISTGDLLRAEMKEGTQLGNEITPLMNSGKYVSDAVVSQLVMNIILTNGKYCSGYIFDGFPRTLFQCEFLDRQFERINGEGITAVINLEVDSKTLIARILERGKTSGREEDTDLTKIKNRLKIYHKETLPILEYYKQNSVVLNINGIGTVEEINTRIVNALTGKEE